VPETIRLTALLPGSFLKLTNSFVVTLSGSGVRVKPGPMSTAVSAGLKNTLIVPFATGTPDSSME